MCSNQSKNCLNGIMFDHWKIGLIIVNAIMLNVTFNHKLYFILANNTIRVNLDPINQITLDSLSPWR